MINFIKKIFCFCCYDDKYKDYKLVSNDENNIISLEIPQGFYFEYKKEETPNDMFSTTELNKIFIPIEDSTNYSSESEVDEDINEEDENLSLYHSCDEPESLK